MKNSRRKEAALVASGIILGATIAAPAAGAALMAQQSSQKIVVDGKAVQIKAYSINGNNYAKLRDIGKAVGFNVGYDAASNTVQINTNEPYAEEAPEHTANSRIVTLPTDGSKYKPQVGDVIRCDNGTLYEVKDTSRFENNCFAPGPLPELPTPSYDWSVFPTLMLPAVECRHFQSEHGDDLYVRNLYETRRMAYTIYEAIKDEPSAWRDGKPLTKVSLTVPVEYEAYTGYFWPWREGEILKQVRSFPGFHFHVEAWDFYHNHTFLQTQYYIFVD